MSQEIFMRGLFSGIFGLALMMMVFSRYDTEVGSESTGGDRQKYLPYIPESILPIYLLTLIALAIFLFGVRSITQGIQWLIKKTDFCNGSARAKIRSLCEQTAEKIT